ncbi:DUF4175 domain-containing protein [Xylanimonas oleitrophica]|uniref:DUF4175 domain-containing protein n=1 Tax=Xylanimonas oleitrophica TaxID=2607479 RepID=UPI0011B61006|nr:DUF4175 domain-containing protein [Xylanimonas oleitrophica]
MYGALWRALPGPGWFRALVMVALLVGAVAACFQWFFPWLSTYVPINDNTVG